MRKLAEQVGAGTMSLYSHVANRDDLIAAMVDEICRDIDHPVVGDEWRGAMRTTAASAHSVLMAHPWAAREWTTRMPGPERMRYMDAILRTLTEAGLDDDVVYHGYHAITMHIAGFTVQELGYLAMPIGGEVETMAHQFMVGPEDRNMPHLAEHVRAHVGDHDHGDDFGWILDLILDGLERSGRT